MWGLSAGRRGCRPLAANRLLPGAERSAIRVWAAAGLAPGGEQSRPARAGGRAGAAGESALESPRRPEHGPPPGVADTDAVATTCVMCVIVCCGWDLKTTVKVHLNLGLHPTRVLYGYEDTSFYVEFQISSSPVLYAVHAAFSFVTSNYNQDIILITPYSARVLYYDILGLCSLVFICVLVMCGKLQHPVFPPVGPGRRLDPSLLQHCHSRPTSQSNKPIFRRPEGTDQMFGCSRTVSPFDQVLTSIPAVYCIYCTRAVPGTQKYHSIRIIEQFCRVSRTFANGMVPVHKSTRPLVERAF